MKRARLSLLAFGLFALAACDDPYQPTLRPDYVIRVAPTTQGSVAMPPPCPSWATENADPYDEQPEPQFGCASARNLASMVDNPNDLIQGRPLGSERGVTAVGTVRRYDNNQARGLVWPGADTSQAAITTSPSSSSTMTGDVTGGTPSTSSSAGAAAAP